MSKVDIARALKDKAYYNSLTAAEKATVPGNPAGDSELSDSELDKVSGGAAREPRPTTKVRFSEGSRSKVRAGCITGRTPGVADWGIGLAGSDGRAKACASCGAAGRKGGIPSPESP